MTAAMSGTNWYLSSLSTFMQQCNLLQAVSIKGPLLSQHSYHSSSLFNLQDITKGYHQSLLTQSIHLESPRCLEWKDTFFSSCSLEPCTLELRVYLVELKSGVEEKVGDVTYIEDEELQYCQWCMSIHCLSSGVCAGVCCKENCKECSPKHTTYLLCCFAFKGDSLINESGECHKWSVPLHTWMQCPLMHACMCIAVGSNVRQSVHPSLLSMQSRWICLRSSAQAMSRLTTGDLMDQDLQTKN